MCPSYRATVDEQHVTRGRANTLRLALSGQLGPDALTSAAMAATLDLCVACKACRRECPTGVDMARMKIEVLHQIRRREPLPLRDRVIAYLPRYAPQASRARWLMHLRDRVPGAAALSERALGFSARRSLPRWHPRPYRPAAKLQPLPGDGRDVVLFADTFTTWFEPDNARAAVAVLEAGGYRVHAPQPPARRPLCCGRTFLAAGLVEQARREARATLAALSPLVGAAVPVLGLEPSCLLTMRDEFTALLPGQATAALAEHALLLEEFLWREQAAGRLSLALQRGRQAPGAGAWSLPSEGVRRHGGADRLPRHGSRAAGRDHRVRAVAGWRARSATRPSTMRFRYAWRSWRCCLRCAPPSPTRSSSPMARAAGTRSTTAPAARRCTRRASSRTRWLTDCRPAATGRRQTALVSTGLSRHERSPGRDSLGPWLNDVPVGIPRTRPAMAGGDGVSSVTRLRALGARGCKGQQRP